MGFVYHLTVFNPPCAAKFRRWVASFRLPVTVEAKGRIDGTRDIIALLHFDDDPMQQAGSDHLVAANVEADIEQRLKTEHANNPKAWAWVAVREARVKNFDAAAECFHEAVRLDSENRQYRIHLGLTLARARRYEEGFEWLKRSMKQAEARFALAKMMIHNGDTEQAREYLHAAMRADPTFMPAKDQLMALTIGGSDVRTVGYEEPAGR